MKPAQTNNCINFEEVKILFATKPQLVKVIDVRSNEEYNLEHIPGAINIPNLEIEKANNLFDKNVYLITACGKGGGRSTEAAEKLKSIGFKNATWLCGGTFGWLEINK